MMSMMGKVMSVMMNRWKTHQQNTLYCQRLQGLQEGFPQENIDYCEYTSFSVLDMVVFFVSSLLKICKDNTNQSQDNINTTIIEVRTFMML
jgi:hypothetical protein